MSDDLLSQQERDALLAQGGQGGESDALTDSASEEAGDQSPITMSPQPEASIRSAELGSFGGAMESSGARNSVDLIFDVQLNVAVELGRATLNVRDILSLGPGSVVELDKSSGEPVEVVVNNKVVARGEVVVIDENFGVRITEIISPNTMRDTRAKAA